MTRPVGSEAMRESTPAPPVSPAKPAVAEREKATRSTELDADVYIGGEPYDALDDIKALRHVPCGAVLSGDTAIAEHICEPGDDG